MGEYRYQQNPLVVVKAEGPYLELADGTRILDGNGSWWVSTLGHNHPRLVAALCTQAQKMCHCSLADITHEPAALLAQEISAIAPHGLDQVFYTDNGSTAVEAAVKMAVQFFAQEPNFAARKKMRFVALDGAFHGDTVGASSLGSIDVFRKIFAGLLFDCIHIPVPSHATQTYSAFEALTQIVTQHHHELAGIVVEPVVQGASGMRMYDPMYVRNLRELCDRYNMFLIFDEVFTGYGRLGTMWASELANVVPDFMCVAKGFSGGVLPMGAVLTHRHVLNGFNGGREHAFLYGHSFCGNPLGAAVAREVLAIYRDEQVLAGIPERHARIQSMFQQLQQSPITSRIVQNTRSLGMIGAADLSDTTSGYTATIGWDVYHEARTRGAYLRPLGNTIYVSPALNIPLSSLDQLLNIVYESVESVAKRYVT